MNKSFLSTIGYTGTKYIMIILIELDADSNCGLIATIKASTTLLRINSIM